MMSSMKKGSMGGMNCRGGGGLGGSGKSGGESSGSLRGSKR